MRYRNLKRTAINLFKSVRLEIVKAIVALVSLCTLAVIGHFLGEKWLVLYVLTQATIITCASIGDLGSNVRNMDISIEGGRFVNVNISSIGFIVMLLAVTTIFALLNLDIKSPSSYLFLFVAIVSQIYIMRWNTVQRREGEYLRAAIYGELLPAAIRALFVGICIYLPDDYYLISFLLPFFIASLVLKTMYEVIDLNYIVKKNSSKFPFSYSSYSSSIVSALKNQSISFFLPLVSNDIRADVVTVSRIYGLASLGASGVISRVPYSVKQKTHGYGFSFIKLIYITVCIVGLLILALPSIFSVISNFLGVPSNIDYLSIFFVFSCLVICGVLQSFMTVYFQSKGMPFRALMLDIVYISLILIFMWII